MADLQLAPDTPELRARWGGFAWSKDNAGEVPKIIARYPLGRERSAVMPRVVAMLGVLSLLSACGNDADNVSELTPKKPAKDLPVLTVAEVKKLGFVLVASPIDGLTPPSYHEDGKIGEGTPIVSTIYFGVKNVPSSERDRRFRCPVPEEYQIGTYDFEELDTATWKCEKLNG